MANLRQWRKFLSEIRKWPFSIHWQEKRFHRSLPSDAASNENLFAERRSFWLLPLCLGQKLVQQWRKRHHVFIGYRISLLPTAHHKAQEKKCILSRKDRTCADEEEFEKKPCEMIGFAWKNITVHSHKRQSGQTRISQRPRIRTCAIPASCSWHACQFWRGSPLSRICRVNRHKRAAWKLIVPQTELHRYFFQ